MNLFKQFKQGDLVKMLVQPEVYGVIVLTYDGKFEPECELHTGTGKIVTGLQYVRKVSLNNEHQRELVERFSGRMNMVDDRAYRVVYGTEEGTRGVEK